MLHTAAARGRKLDAFVVRKKGEGARPAAPHRIRDVAGRRVLVVEHVDDRWYGADRGRGSARRGRRGCGRRDDRRTRSGRRGRRGGPQLPSSALHAGRPSAWPNFPALLGA